MRTPTTPPRTADLPVRALTTLVALVVGLAAAFVFAPPALAAIGGDGDLAGRKQLAKAFRAALVGYWRSGDRDYPPALQRIVDYWFRFHLIKGGIAVLLLIVFVALAVLIWRTRLRGDGLGAGSRAALVSAGAAVPVLALFALFVVMANVQGAVAPFASLFPMLIGPRDAGVAGVLAQGRQELAGSHRTSGYSPPALDAMVSDFGLYHAEQAVAAVVVLVALLGLGVLLWRRFARVGPVARMESAVQIGSATQPEPAGRRTRPVLAWFGVFSVVSALIVVVLLIANAGVARDPAPALLALFNGSF